MESRNKNWTDMKISNFKFEQQKPLSLTDFINYAKSQGYLVQPENLKHWASEYQEYIKNYESIR